MDSVEKDCCPALGELGNQFALPSVVALRQDVGILQVVGDMALPCAAGVLFRDLYPGEARSLTFATE